MASYRHVFQPLQVGGCRLKNRVCRSAHGTGLHGDELIAYHEARAKGGVALSFLEAGSVHASAPFPMDISNDHCISLYLQLMDRVSPYDMKVMQQLYYPGATGGYWSASDVPNPLLSVTPKAMSPADIEEIIDSFAKAAQRCETGGLHGVDIHASSGYLLHEFLSPALNHRQDDYGGSRENRLRLLLEVLDAVRSVVSKDFVVGVRLPNEDYTPGGLNAEENAAIAEAIDPLIDYLSLHMGSYWRFHKLIAPSDDPLGLEMPFNQVVTRHTTKPRIVVGRIMTLDHADALIRDNEAEMVSMVRALIADPELVNKAQRGEEQHIRPCIGSNQGCVGKLMTDGRISCVVNPSAAREQSLSFDPSPSTTPLKLLVIGGGPAGMEAARNAALMGHKVILAEALPRLGGQLAMAACAPHRGDLGSLNQWLQSELETLNVDIRCNTLVDIDWITDINPDHVILATGSTPRWDGRQIAQPSTSISGYDQAHVSDSWRLFGVGQPLTIGKSALVFDDTGTFEAISVADALLKQGAAVTLVSRFDSIGHELPYPPVTVGAARERLFNHAQFEFFGGHYLRNIRENEVDIGVLHTERCRTVAAENVVLVLANQPNRELLEDIEKQSIAVTCVGDINGSRDLLTAMHSASEAARSLT